jgi:hypothetical protein
MAGRGFDREFTADHLQPFPHAEQSQSSVSFRAEHTFHIKRFAVVDYRQANPVRQFFNLNSMPYRNSGIDDAYRVLDSSFAASVFA